MITCIAFFLIAFLPLHGDLALEAHKSYTAGEQAKEAEVRKKDFNDALSAYLRLETENPSGELCYDIANTYFQLGEYGYAILYYNKALKELPRDHRIHNNLSIAYDRAGIVEPQESILEYYLLFFHHSLSHNEKVWLALVFIFLTLIFLSIDLWTVYPFCKVVGSWSAVLAALFIASISWNEYFARKDAIIVRPTSLRRDAGQEYASIQAEPALPGMKAEVLAAEKEGSWMKVRLQSGQEGYIAKEDIRLV